MWWPFRKKSLRQCKLILVCHRHDSGWRYLAAEDESIFCFEERGRQSPDVIRIVARDVLAKFWPHRSYFEAMLKREIMVAQPDGTEVLYEVVDFHTIFDNEWMNFEKAAIGRGATFLPINEHPLYAEHLEKFY